MEIEEQFEAELYHIAGKNAVGSDRPDIRNLCHALNYMKTQSKILAGIEGKESRMSHREAMLSAAANIIKRED